MKNTKGKIKKIFVGALAGLTLLSGLTFVGCHKEPENNDPDIEKDPPIIEVEKNKAETLTELQTRYPQQVENFVGEQFDKVLEDLEIEENITADYEIIAGESGITSIKFTFEYNHHSYTAFANFENPLTFEAVANFESDEALTDAIDQAIESSTTQHEKEYILNHVESLEELKETYPEKVNQFLNTQFAYAFENKGFAETEDNKVKDRTADITADENGVQKVEYTYTFNGREQNISVEYTSPISLDTLANYPEHEQSKEQVVEAMLSSKIDHEIPLSSYTDQEIISLFQDQINANLYDALYACSQYFEEDRTLSITKYQWHLGEITDGKVQNLQVHFLLENKQAAAIRHVFNVKLKKPTSLAELAKENNPVQFNKLSASAGSSAYYYSYIPAEQKEDTFGGRALKIITEQMPDRVSDFDFANAESVITYGTVGNSVAFDVYYSLGNEIRHYVIETIYYGSGNLYDGHLSKLENGNWNLFRLEEQFNLVSDNVLEWATPAPQNENAN